ncbi:hypothetical protein CRE_06276 [Caenorhabditis remanei]|uniref:Uncharacterized protein n=1 Tax=Caenorhabditis remanei TaxID=31234 RepID=E3NWA5_CAERE|nr:hypothetical protein CRE_06276 [Caenorhabditis remanei]
MGLIFPSKKVSSDDAAADDVQTNQSNQKGKVLGPSAIVPVAPAPVEEAQQPVEEVAVPDEEVPAPVDQDAAQPVEEHVPEDPISPLIALMVRNQHTPFPYNRAPSLTREYRRETQSFFPT